MERAQHTEKKKMKEGDGHLVSYESCLLDAGERREEEDHKEGQGMREEIMK